MPRFPRIPDLLTTANLACGVSAILLAGQGQLTIACGLVFLAALFDVSDGLAARALGGGTPLGAQLDSLADMVSFGLAPALVIWFGSEQGWYPNDVIGPAALPFFIALIPICSAWRLAKFNVDTRQTSGFLGLATPANALFWVSLPMIVRGTCTLHGPGYEYLHAFALLPLVRVQVFAVVSVVLCVLMLSELPLRSLKLKSTKWKGNEVIYLLLLIGVVLGVLYGIAAIPPVLVIYVLSPLWGKLFPKPRAN